MLKPKQLEHNKHSPLHVLVFDYFQMDLMETNQDFHSGVLIFFFSLFK